MTIDKQDITEDKEVSSITAKRKIKDSVFTDLFNDKKYLIQLYKALHPEDDSVSEDDLTIITLNKILVDEQYNDLGFLVGDRLLLLVEAQSSWSVNILVRGMIYIVQSYREYIYERGIDIYGSKPVTLPKAELYVILSKERKKQPEYISLSEAFFGGAECAIEARAKIIYGGTGSDIINQYIVFTRIMDEQIGLHGRTRKAVTEAIRICSNKDVLKEYLETKKSEVIDIMMLLFDQDTVLDIHVKSEKKEAAIRNTIEIYKSLGKSIEETIDVVAKKFKLKEADATERVNEIWNEIEEETL